MNKSSEYTIILLTMFLGLRFVNMLGLIDAMNMSQNANREKPIKNPKGKIEVFQHFFNTVINKITFSINQHAEIVKNSIINAQKFYILFLQTSSRSTHLIIDASNSR